MDNMIDQAVTDYLDKISDAGRQADCRALAELMSRETGQSAAMYGAAIVGFGTYHYRYDSGREGDAPLAGFSSRAANIALYLAVYDGREEALTRLGRHKTGKGCIYINTMSDIDAAVLAEIVHDSVAARVAAHSA